MAAAQGWGGGAVVCDFAQGSDSFNTFNRTQKPAPPLLHREREEPDAWQGNCEVILTARESWQSLVQTVTSAQAAEYASLQSC